MGALTDYDASALAGVFGSWGHRPSHALRLLRAFYRSGGEPDLAGLRLGRELLARLEREIPLRQSSILKRSESGDGTVKLLVGFCGGGAVEAVLMPAFAPQRAAGCISSQIGCAMGCDFCASTRAGLERNLGAGEIVEQFLHLRHEAMLAGRRIATLVFMGMGEPMHNLEAVIKSIRRIASPQMGELGPRQITVSTVGIIPGMEALADANLNVHLAVSLHAPDDATRSRIVPANRRYPVADIMAGAARFQERTGRIVTIEYCLLRGVNDADLQAEALAGLIHRFGFRPHVNIIPYNSIGTGISGAVYETPTPGGIKRFLDILRSRSIVAHARRTRGGDVNAACGQLRETALGLL